jgi:peptidoglycan hydrolase-like protein with peptidoglycan-binding domain
MTKKGRAVPARNQRVIDFDDEPGLLGAIMRPVLSRPMDSLASAVAAAATLAIVLNALAFQDGQHPAPIFGLDPLPAEEAPQASAPAAARKVAAPAPRPSSPATTATITPSAPAAAPQTPAAPTPAREDLVRAVQGELARLGRYDGAVDGLFGPMTDFAIRDYERATGRVPSGEPTPQLLEVLKASKAPAKTAAAPVPAAPAGTTPSKRILAIQQVLAEQGYGPIKLDGVLGEATKTAIFRFEVHRNLPPTGEISTRFIRELSAVSGVPLE